MLPSFVRARLRVLRHLTACAAFLLACQVRFNKKQYDRACFTEAGIHHFDLFYEDGGTRLSLVLSCCSDFRGMTPTPVPFIRTFWGLKIVALRHHHLRTSSKRNAGAPRQPARSPGVRVHGLQPLRLCCEHLAL